MAGSRRSRSLSDLGHSIEDDERGGGRSLSDLADASQAFLEHYGNVASGNYLPAFQAMTEPAMTRALDLVNSTNVAEELPGYVERRDDNRRRLKEEAEKHPVASGLGDLAGFGGALLLLKKHGPLNRVPSNDGLADSLKLLVAGAAVNPGDTPGERDGLQVKERLSNGIGALGVGAGWYGLKHLRKGR